MKPYMYIDGNMGLPNRGMAFMSKIWPWESVPEGFWALADLGIALEVQLLRLQSHQL